MSKKNQWTFVSKEELDKIIADSFSNTVTLSQAALLQISSGVERFVEDKKKDDKEKR